MARLKEKALEMLKERNDILNAKYDEQKVRAMLVKFSPNNPIISGMSSQGVEGAFYKTRVALGIRTEESTKWLIDHGFNPTIKREPWRG
ncbi:hypothetical protein KAR91_69325 [Candidatus Pacearchaeota archaeon]|nr:hypothetical protein [Candidatus Pacearchaeota archaeon]